MILQTYLKNIENISIADKEHTYRTALENLLNSIKEHLAITNKALIPLSSNTSQITTRRAEVHLIL